MASPSNTAQQAAPATAGIGGIKKTLKIPSLNSLKDKSIESILPTKKEENKVEEWDEDVALENLKSAWSGFTDKVKAEGRDQLFIILNQGFKLKEDLTIEIKLSSSLQEDTLDLHRTELTQYLRSTLKNSKINISSILVQEHSKKMIYTPQEKFNHLAEKHPALLELRERLGLDPDY